MMSDDPGRAMSYRPESRVLDVAAAAMSRELGAPVRLEPAPGPLCDRKPVLRCSVASAPTTAPPTVIVKHLPRRPAQSRLGLFNEWAALRFLSQLELEPPVSPALYGGDLDEGVLVLEDLGDGDCLADVLLGSDSARAEAALVSLARTLGRMQAASIDRAADHRRIRSALGARGGEAIIEARDLASRFEGTLRAAGLSLQGADEDVEAAIDRVARPGAFLAFVHGDACPSNERLVDGEIVLLDFATAGLRHALLDGVCGRVPFPSCWCARRLPRHVPRRMEEAYRSELVLGCPAAKDDARFAGEAVAATAYWLIETTTVAISTMPFRDFVWGTSTIGQRLALRTALFAELAADSGSYLALSALLTRLVDVLGLADEEMPLYPAFGGPP